MFPYTFSLVLFFCYVSYSVVGAIPSTLTTNNEHEALELNQSAIIILRKYEEQLKNLILDLERKIISLQQSNSNCQQIEQTTSQTLETTKQEIQIDEEASRNLWESLVKRSRLEEKITSTKYRLENFKKILEKAQTEFEKIKTETISEKKYSNL